MRIVLNDANILIDLIHLELEVSFFQLEQLELKSSRFNSCKDFFLDIADLIILSFSCGLIFFLAINLSFIKIFDYFI